MIDKNRLVSFLKDRAVNASTQEPSMLVNYAMYMGLAERIQRGDFDYVVNEDPDLDMHKES